MSAFEVFNEACQIELASVMPERLAAVDWRSEELRAHQTTLMRELLDHAKTHSPWHRERLKDIDPSTFELDEVDRLPTMTKADFNQHFDDISTDPRVTRDWCETYARIDEPFTDGTYCLLASGGTSGVRAVQVYTPREAAQFIGLNFRTVLRHGMKTATVPSSGKMFIIAAAKGASHATEVIARLVGNLPDEHQMAVTDPIDEIIARLNQIQPTAIMMYSSFLNHLIQVHNDGRLKISPAVLTLTSETPSLLDIERAKKIWNCHIGSIWASVEFGIMGASSGFQDGHLLSDDLLLIEAIDENNVPVPPDTQADKLLLTNLCNKTLPLIRYEMTDQLIIYAKPAECGSCLRAASFVHGRLDDHFVYDGGVRVHSHLFSHVLEQYQDILEYQIKQTKRGAQISLVETDPIDIGEITATLERDLERIGVASPHVDVAAVTAIERTAAQKIRRFISL